MTKGDRIRYKREYMQLSQADLAKKIGVAPQTIYKYEKSIVVNIPDEIVDKLSDALHCTPAYIYGWDDDLESGYIVDTSFEVEVSKDIQECAAKLAMLTPDNLINAKKYIDYLLSTQ